MQSARVCVRASISASVCRLSEINRYSSAAFRCNESRFLVEKPITIGSRLSRRRSRRRKPKKRHGQRVRSPIRIYIREPEASPLYHESLVVTRSLARRHSSRDSANTSASTFHEAPASARLLLFVIRLHVIALARAIEDPRVAGHLTLYARRIVATRKGERRGTRIDTSKCDGTFCAKYSSALFHARNNGERALGGLET